MDERRLREPTRRHRPGSKRVSFHRSWGKANYKASDRFSEAQTRSANPPLGSLLQPRSKKEAMDLGTREQWILVSPTPLPLPHPCIELSWWSLAVANIPHFLFLPQLESVEPKEELEKLTNLKFLEFKYSQRKEVPLWVNSLPGEPTEPWFQNHHNLNKCLK